MCTSRRPNANFCTNCTFLCRVLCDAKVLVHELFMRYSHLTLFHCFHCMACHVDYAPPRKRSPRKVIGFTVLWYLTVKSTVISEQHSYVAILQYDAGRFDPNIFLSCRLPGERLDLKQKGSLKVLKAWPGLPRFTISYQRGIGHLKAWLYSHRTSFVVC